MGYVAEDNRALLRKVHWDQPLQSVWDEKLVLGRLMPVEETDSLAVRWEKIDNDDADKKVLEPAKWDLGTDFPEVSISELGYDSTVIDGLGIMVKFDPKRIYYSDGTLGIVDAQRRILRKWAKKVEREIYADLTNNRATAKGTQFDPVLTQMSGGLATGSQKHLIFQAEADKAWNQQGDAIQQMREVCTSITAMNRLANLGGDVEFDPKTSVVFLDSLTYGALHDQLRDADVKGIDVGTSAVTVPSLYGVTFATAEEAITNTGEALMMDLAATPYVYKQSLPPLPQYHRVSFDPKLAGGAKDKIPGSPAPSPSKLSLLVRDDDREDGSVEVRFAHLGKSLLRKQKSVAFLHGLFA